MARGSKPGERRGGRKKGTTNKATKKRRDIAEKALEQGKSPLEVLLEAMNDAYKTGGAAAAAAFAKDAAPYVHPKLATIAADVKQDLTIELVSYAGDGDAG
jgi:hypothetical protein